MSLRHSTLTFLWLCVYPVQHLTSLLLPLHAISSVQPHILQPSYTISLILFSVRSAIFRRKHTKKTPRTITSLHRLLRRADKSKQLPLEICNVSHADPPVPSIPQISARGPKAYTRHTKPTSAMCRMLRRTLLVVLDRLPRITRPPSAGAFGCSRQRPSKSSC